MIDSLIIGVVVIGAFASVFYLYRRDQDHLARLRQLANEAFAECIVESPDPKYMFSGRSATVERREEVGGVRGLFESTADFSVTVYALNSQGERFLFKWFSKSPKPFVKHLAA
jgi:hypothetical protein